MSSMGNCSTYAWGIFLLLAEGDAFTIPNKGCGKPFLDGFACRKQICKP